MLPSYLIHKDFKKSILKYDYISFYTKHLSITCHPRGRNEYVRLFCHNKQSLPLSFTSIQNVRSS